MGTVLPQGNFSVVQGNFHNVPAVFPDASLVSRAGTNLARAVLRRGLIAEPSHHLAAGVFQRRLLLRHGGDD